MVLTRDTLTRQAFNSLVDHIVSGGLQPGDDLPSTSALIEEFGISRPVVREALSALQACGFVDIRNGRTPVVAAVDGRLIQMFVARASQLQKRPMSGLMEVRLPLEIQAARLAAARADDDTIRAIVDANVEMAGAIRDSERYPRLDTAFHSSIAGAAGNPILDWMIHSIRSELMRVMTSVRAYREAHGLVGEEQRQHDQIADAIRRRDPDAAAVAMEEHIASSMELVRNVEDGAGRKKGVPRQRPAAASAGSNDKVKAETSAKKEVAKAAEVKPRTGGGRATR
jgi:DNA-binding FadR family transcriptional regulator